VNINGSDFATLYYTPTSNTTSVATFALNFNGVVQDFFSNLLPLPSIPEWQNPINKTNNGYLAEIQITFYSYKPNADNLLVRDPSGVNSSVSKAINSTVQSLTSITSTTDRQWLTSKPSSLFIQRDEHDQSAIYLNESAPQNDGIARFRLRTFNAQGLWLKEKQLEAAKLSKGERIVIFGTGPANLSGSIPWDLEIASGTIQSPILFEPPCAYYEIDALSEGGAPLSLPIRYYFDRSLCNVYRIHFLNEYGYYDSVSVRQNIFDTFSTDSELFSSSGDFESSVSRIRNRLYSQSTDGFTAHFQDLTQEQVTWLKQLANTPQSFLERNNQPMIVQDLTNSPTRNSEAPKTELILRFLSSNPKTSQRN